MLAAECWITGLILLVTKLWGNLSQRLDRADGQRG